MKFNVLGPPELLTTGNQEITVSPQLWCVLVSLVMTPNVPVSAEMLVDRLWDDDPTPKARTTIRTYISRINRLLSEASAGTAHVSRQAHSYSLEVDPHTIDLHRFRSLKRQSNALADSGEERHAAMLLREAEALWRGTALAGLPGDWIWRMRDTLEEELRAVTARRIELELTLGRHAELLAELGQLTERHPLDETLAGHRMIALFRSGRQADSLRVYQETRARLVAVGVEPGPDLAQLHRRILQHDPELAITPAYRRAGQRPQPNTLPPDVTDFVGRAKEIRLLKEDAGRDALPALRIVEGMGGVGKTSLAVHVGHQMMTRYPDAQLFLSFRAHDQQPEPLVPGDALRDLLMMLDLPAAMIPGTLAERKALWQAELACRRAVIIFDDVTGPDQISPLLPDTGDCMIIVTSRRRHPTWGKARKLTLRVMTEEDAVALFGQIAGSTAGREHDQAAEVSRLCNCLPLAIRLAASHLRSGGETRLPDLLDELGESATGHGQVSEVSHRIQAAFELSYRRLDASAQRFFRYLGISPCRDITAYSGAVLTGFTLTESRAALTVLSDHHLLDEISPGRFGFHDLIRTFAAAHFADEEPEQKIRHAVGQLADYYIHSVNGATRLLRGHHHNPSADGDGVRPPAPFTDRPEAAEVWLEAEWVDALRVAEHCARHEWKRRCADLVHVLAEFLETSGHWDEALAAHGMAFHACHDLDDLPGVARSAFDLSLTSLRTGHGEAALQYATDAAVAFGTLGDRRGQAAALDRLGIIHRNAARFRESLAYHQEALDMYREAHDPTGLAKALAHAGTALGYLGRHSEEMSCLNQALDIYRQTDDLRGQAITLNSIGIVQFYKGLHRDSLYSYQASLGIFRRIGGRQSLALVDHNLARLYEYKGNYKAALVVYRQVLTIYRSIGDLQHQACALTDIGSAYQCAERFDEALAHHRQAASIGEKAGDRYVYTLAVCRIAETHYGSGHIKDALEGFEQAVRLAGEIESLYLRARALNGMAEITLRTRGREAARIYWREAHDIFAQLGVAEAAAVEVRLNALDVSAS